MQKVKGILCFYLTAAFMITLALMPFASGNVIRGEVFSEKAGNVSEAVVTSGGTVFPDFSQASQEIDITENMTAEEHHGNIDDTSETELYNKAEAATQHDLNKDSLSEELTEVQSVTEDVYKTPELHSSEGTGKDAEASVIEADTNDTYIPGAVNETVYGLNFFTDTVGFLESADSINVYEFTLDNRSVFRYTVYHDEFTSTEGWNFDLYAEYYINGDKSETGYRLVNSLLTSVSSSDRSVELGLLAGNYRLVVTKGISYTGAAFRISVTHSETSEYEVECNDNVFRYTSLYSDSPIKGSASKFPDKQDEDWYMFRMYEDGYIELQFKHPAEKDKITVCWQVIFCSEDMTRLFSVNSTFDSAVFDSGRIGLPKGNYYIAVINRVYTDITYTLSVDRNVVADHENERNDTAETANPIAPNTTVLGSISSQISGIDVDYYRFTLEKAGTVVVEFSHTPIEDDDDKQGWNYKLLDSNGNVLFCGISSWIDDVAVSSAVGLGAGTYYISVDSEGLYHNTEKYYLSLIYSELPNWETEYNDSFDSADMLSAGVIVNGLLADRNVDYDFDYYAFEIKDTSDVSVVFSHEVLAYSREIFEFRLYDENYNAVYTERDGNSVNRISVKSDEEEVEVHYTSLPAGKYYIKVATGIFFDAIGYSLIYKTS